MLDLTITEKHIVKIHNLVKKIYFLARWGVTLATSRRHLWWNSSFASRFHLVIRKILLLPHCQYRSIYQAFMSNSKKSDDLIRGKRGCRFFLNLNLNRNLNLDPSEIMIKSKIKIKIFPQHHFPPKFANRGERIRNSESGKILPRRHGVEDIDKDRRRRLLMRLQYKTKARPRYRWSDWMPVFLSWLNFCRGRGWAR